MLRKPENMEQTATLYTPNAIWAGASLTCFRSTDTKTQKSGTIKA